MKLNISRRIQVGAGLTLLAAVVIGVSLAPNFRADATGASPTTLDRIARKNDRAAIEAATQMRVESRSTAEAADRLRAAEERGRAQADKALAGYDNSEARRSDSAPTVSQ